MEKTLGCVLLISGLILTTGCAAVRTMAEGEEVTPEQIALEVIVTEDACSLNVDEVGAATHVVSVITEHGRAHVRILDRTDALVFEADALDISEQTSEDQPKVGAAGEGEPEAVRLVPGDYRVECSIGTSASMASLHVVPASGSTEE
jgi:hypothetical protein